VSVALDCLAVYVNKDNPIKGLTLAELDGIFSKTHKSVTPTLRFGGKSG